MVPITSKAMKSMAFGVAGAFGCTAVRSVGVHDMYSAATCRVREKWNVAETYKQSLSAGKSVGGSVNMGASVEGIAGGTGGFGAGGTVGAADAASPNQPDGGIYYLPYDDDRITSMILPGNPPPGCRKFLTANMSGCRFFVDRILGSNDLIVYHANTHQHGSSDDGPANAQSAAASTILENMHNAASNDYRQRQPSIIAVPVGQLVKYDYLMPGEAEALRKRGQGRTNTALVSTPRAGDPTQFDQAYTPGQPVRFLGGTTIFGEFDGIWRFFYQTFGNVAYDRKTGAARIAQSLITAQWTRVHKIRTQGARNTLESKVLACKQFLP